MNQDLLFAGVLIEERKNINNFLSGKGTKRRKQIKADVLGYIDASIDNWKKGGENLKDPTIQNIHMFLLENNVNCLKSDFHVKRFGLPKSQWNKIDAAILENRKEIKSDRVRRYQAKATNLMKPPYRTRENINSLVVSMDKNNISIENLFPENEKMRNDLKFIFQEKEMDVVSLRHQEKLV